MYQYDVISYNVHMVWFVGTKYCFIVILMGLLVYSLDKYVVIFLHALGRLLAIWLVVRTFRHVVSASTP